MTLLFAQTDTLRMRSGEWLLIGLVQSDCLLSHF